MDRPDFKLAVENVLNGKSALGNTDLKRLVRFTAEPEMRDALVAACQDLSNKISHSFSWDDDNMTLLVRRMAAGVNMYEWDSPALVHKGFNMLSSNLSDALIENPRVFEENQSIPEILKAHGAHAARRIAKLKEGGFDVGTPAPEILRIGDYILVELKTPDHLKEQATLIGGNCCIADYNETALAQNGLSEDDPEADYYMNYAIKMRAGESRNFALRDQGGSSYVTIEYNPLKKVITQIEGNPTKISAEVVFFPALCESLAALEKAMDVSGGVEAEFPERAEALPSMSKDAVSFLARFEGLALEISKLVDEESKRLLPEKIHADLYHSAPWPLNLDHVTEVKDIVAQQTKDVSFQSLKTCGKFWMGKVEVGLFPALEEFEVLHMPKLQNGAFPSCSHGGQISLCAAHSVDLPSLTEIDELNLFHLKEGRFSQMLQYRRFEHPADADIIYVDTDPHDGWSLDDTLDI